MLRTPFLYLFALMILVGCEGGGLIDFRRDVAGGDPGPPLVVFLTGSPPESLPSTPLSFGGGA